MQVKDIVKKVKQIEIQAKKRMDSQLMGQYHSAFKGQGMTFSEVRQYDYGDDIRRIDWNKTARFQTPFVKLMEEERELCMMLLVDISASMNFGTHNEKKRDYIAEICASLAYSAVKNNDKVGLVLFSDKVHKIIPPKSGRSQVLAIISNIISSEYKPSNSNIDYVLEHTLNFLKKKSLIFLFSDFENILLNKKKLSVASKKHQLLAFKVHDSIEEQIPDIGYTFFQNIECGEKMWVNTSSKKWRENYREAQQQKLHDLENLFQRSAAHIVKISSDDDYSRLLFNYFQKKK